MPGRAGPLRLGGAEVAAEVTEAGRGEQRVADRVQHDVAVGVALEAHLLLGPIQSGHPHRTTGCEAVHVRADADAQVHGTIMPGPRHIWLATCATMEE